MTLYRRKLDKPLALDTPTVRAAVNLVLAVEAGEQPDGETLRTLHDAFLDLFGGKPPSVLFGSACGFALPKGRPIDSGFTPADVVSAFIELERRFRERRGEPAALSRAQEAAIYAFVELRQKDPRRAVKRDWETGRDTVERLDDDDLAAIIAPYRVPDE